MRLLCTLAFAELQLQHRLLPAFGELPEVPGILWVQSECALESRYQTIAGAQSGSTSFSTTGCTVTRLYYNLTLLTAGKVTFNKEFESRAHLVVMRSCSNTGTVLQMQGSVIFKNKHR